MSGQGTAVSLNDASLYFGSYAIVSENGGSAGSSVLDVDDALLRMGRVRTCRWMDSRRRCMLTAN